MNTILLAVVWVCGARSALLHRYFYAVDPLRSVARAKALDNCRQGSLVGCYSTGCKQEVAPREDGDEEVDED